MNEIQFGLRRHEKSKNEILDLKWIIKYMVLKEHQKLRIKIMN